MNAPAQHCYVIAEIGINHNGDLDVARHLIDMAVECGADAVKFQKRAIDVVYAGGVLEEPRESPWGTTQRDQKEGLEFGPEEFSAIDEHCKQRGIDWFGSAWDVESFDFLAAYDPPHHKIASTMLTHRDFLERVAASGTHTYVSTAMSTLKDVDQAVEVFRSAGCPFTLMHSVATYPMRDADANLGVMAELARRYEQPVGFSSHEVGLVCSLMAATLGAVAIERHITLDRTMYGSDQAASLERAGLQRLVRDIRLMPEIYGDGVKRVLADEEPVAAKLRYFA